MHPQDVVAVKTGDEQTEVSGAGVGGAVFVVDVPAVDQGSRTDGWAR